MLPEWTSRRPATTIVGSTLVSGPGTSVFVRGGVSRQDRPGAYPASHSERGTLQSYLHDFNWGVKRAAEQIGNAVPPLVARKVLESLWT